MSSILRCILRTSTSTSIWLNYICQLLDIIINTHNTNLVSPSCGLSACQETPPSLELGSQMVLAVLTFVPSSYSQILHHPDAVNLLAHVSKFFFSGRYHWVSYLDRETAADQDHEALKEPVGEYYSVKYITRELHVHPQARVRTLWGAEHLCRCAVSSRP